MCDDVLRVYRMGYTYEGLSPPRLSFPELPRQPQGSLLLQLPPDGRPRDEGTVRKRSRKDKGW